MPAAVRVELYRMMVLIRSFEEAIRHAPALEQAVLPRGGRTTGAVYDVLAS